MQNSALLVLVVKQNEIAVGVYHRELRIQHNVLHTVLMTSCCGVCRVEKLIAISVCTAVLAKCTWHQFHTFIVIAAIHALLRRQNAYLVEASHRCLATRFLGAPGNYWRHFSMYCMLRGVLVGSVWVTLVDVLLPVLCSSRVLYYASFAITLCTLLPVTFELMWVLFIRNRFS